MAFIKYVTLKTFNDCVLNVIVIMIQLFHRLHIQCFVFPNVRFLMMNLAFVAGQPFRVVFVKLQNTKRR